ncbi:MAG: hypothetical protein EA427_07870 [Spirochaetaceae bacterium]|nr:MAG: hypothetical protein EA427_07870 [Spirochaetaceae bacterium]
MSYAIEILRIAQKQLGRIDRTQQQHTIEAIRNLVVQPCSGQVHPRATRSIDRPYNSFRILRRAMGRET